MSSNKWQEVKLRELLTVNYGKSLPKKSRVEGKYNVYGSGGITGTHKEKLVNGPGIIIGRKGTVGALYYEEGDYYPIDTVYYVEQSFKYNLKFLYYKLKTMNLDKMNTHSAVPGLNREHLYSQTTLIPEIDEQKAIAKILSDLDEKIEINNKINKKLEEMAQAIFKQWFVDFEFPNEDGKPYKSSGGEMVESELGMIPSGWRVDTIDNITKLIIDYRGKTPKKLGANWSEEGVLALSAKNIKNYSLVNLDKANKVSEELYNKWMKDKLQSGDILMTSEAPLGEFYYLANESKYCLSQRLYAIRSNEEIIKNSLLYYSLISDAVKSEIINRGTGTTITGIRQSELRKVNVIIPDINIQNLVSHEFDKILLYKEILTKEINLLINIRETLLPKLMSGEIRVPID